MTKYLLLLLLAGTALADIPLPSGYDRATYSAASGAISPPATPTDVCKISGSATKTVYVTRFEMSTTQTTAGINQWLLIKRSTDNTATHNITAMTAVPHNARAVAAGASTVAYTQNPTALGTVVGNVKTFHVSAPAPGSVVPSTILGWDLNRDRNVQTVQLNGTGEVLALNFNGAALPTGLSVNCNWTWTEE